MQGIKESPKRDTSKAREVAMRRITPGEFAQKAAGTEDYGGSLNDRMGDSALDLDDKALTAKDYARRR